MSAFENVRLAAALSKVMEIGRRIKEGCEKGQGYSPGSAWRDVVIAWALGRGVLESDGTGPSNQRAWFSSQLNEVGQDELSEAERQAVREAIEMSGPWVIN